MGNESSEQRAASAIEDGLRLYSQGDLRAALGVWRDALEMDPANKRAREYVRYVEEHFDILDEKIRAARERRESERPPVAATAAAIEMEADEPDDGDAYDAIEVTDTAPAKDDDEDEAVTAAGPAARDSAKSNMGGWQSKEAHRAAAAKVIESIDEGWELDGLDDLVASRAEGTPAPASLEETTEPLADLTGAGGDDALMSDPEAGEVTMPAPRAYKLSVPPPPSMDPFELNDFAPGATVEQEPELPRALDLPRALEPAPEPVPREARVSFRNSTAPPPSRASVPAANHDDETLDRPGIWPIPATDGDVPPTDMDRPSRRPPTEDPSIKASSVEVDDGLLTFEEQTSEARRLPISAMEDAIADLGPPPEVGGGGGGDPDGERPTQLYSRPGAARAPQTISLPLVSAELAAELDDAVPGEEGTDENIKTRVKWLFERATREHKAGRFSLAAVAVDLALSEHPDSAVAQKVVHANRDQVYEIYRNYLGDLGLVPALAQPIDTIPVHELDHRAAFLLTRVDGVLTLEDVLDVSGMARLEAYRHLCRLLMRGFLAVR